MQRSITAIDPGTGFSAAGEPVQGTRPSFAPGRYGDQHGVPAATLFQGLSGGEHHSAQPSARAGSPRRFKARLFRRVSIASAAESIRWNFRRLDTPPKFQSVVSGLAGDRDCAYKWDIRYYRGQTQVLTYVRIR